MRVFVSDAHSRAALQIIRSLGSRGIEVYAGEHFKITPSYFSRYVSGYFVYPNPKTEPKKFVLELNNYCVKNNIEVIIPVVDDVYNAIGYYRDFFSKNIKIPIIEYKKFLMARDKLETMRICEKLDIPHPKTHFSKDLNINHIKKEFNLPIILKPRKSSGSRGISVIKKWQTLEKEFERISKKYGTPMIQEYIPHGGAYGVEVLYNRGRMLRSFTHKRIREFPEGGGPSTVRISTHREDIEKIAKKLMDYLGWHGVAMVEFRIHKETGLPYVMEINPRYWGSLRLAIASGYDIPFAHYRMAIGENVSPDFMYKESVIARWLLFGDILWFLTSKNENKFKEFFIYFFKRNVYYDNITSKDPLPALGAFIEALHFLLDKKKREYALNRGLDVDDNKRDQ